jgi:hypothetical protein
MPLLRRRLEIDRSLTVGALKERRETTRSLTAAAWQERRSRDLSLDRKGAVATAHREGC